MRPRSGALLAVLCLAPAGLAAQAQVTFALSDSVLAVPVTKTGTVELDLYTGCTGASNYSLTVFVDRARVHLLRVDSVPGYGFPAPAIDSSISDQYTLAATGGTAAYCTQPLALLSFSVGSVQTSGSLVSVRLNSATGYTSPVDLKPNYRAEVMDACQADKVWGDVDQSLVVNSRDALITLTAAVGLPVSGPFDLSLGDVDGDKRVTSRDALFILSAGIGLSVPYNVVAGHPIPVRCAPLAPSPADLVFFSDNGMERIAAADTVRSVIPLPANANQASTPRWSPDGSRIAYECFDVYPYSQSICTVSPTGTGLVDLQVVPNGRANGPDWSPDGTQIAFIKNSYSDVWVANANGSGQRQVTSGTVVYDLAWSPDGSRIAFTGYYSCCSAQLFIVNVDGSDLHEVFPSSAAQSPANPSWSAAGDSLVYYNGYWARAYEVAASGSSTAGTPASPLSGYQYQPDWTAAGVGLADATPTRESLYYHRASDGRQLRLTRPPTTAGDRRPDFRRPAGVYVDTVAIAPPKIDSLSVTATGLPSTRTFAASVKNNDGSASALTVRWTSRNPVKLTIDSVSGLATAVSVDSTGVGIYVIATVGGWRSDSALVKVKP